MSVRSTHRRTWKPGRHLMMDEDTGFTHYSDEMVRRPETGLWVHRSNWEPEHPQRYLRPRMDEQGTEVTSADSPYPLGDDYLGSSGYIGASNVQRPRQVGPGDHLFQPGIGKMVIEGNNEFTRFEVD